MIIVIKINCLYNHAARERAKRSRIFTRLKEKRQEILRIAKAHGASNVRVFGSVARGEEGPESYLDLLVEMKPESGLLDLVSLWQDQEDLLGIRSMLSPKEALALTPRPYPCRGGTALKDDRIKLLHIRDALQTHP